MAIESEDFFKDKNLFGSLKSNGNLSKEGNLVFGEGVDDSDDEDAVCLNEPPHLRRKARMTSAVTKMPLPKWNKHPIVRWVCPLGDRSFGTGTSAHSASSTGTSLQVGCCALWKTSAKMSRSD